MAEAMAESVEQRLALLYQRVENLELQEEHIEHLKQRVHNINDKVLEVYVDHAATAARVKSAEESIDRLARTSATSDQLNSVQTIVTLKLDHLLEKHMGTSKNIKVAMWLVVALFVGGLGSFFYVYTHLRP